MLNDTSLQRFKPEYTVGSTVLSTEASCFSFLEMLFLSCKSVCRFSGFRWNCFVKVDNHKTFHQ